MIKLLIHGCHGKMGRTLSQMALSGDAFAVAAGVDKFPDRYRTPFPIYGHIGDCDDQADVVIDFSRPEALPPLVDWCRRMKKPLIVATTGLTQSDYALLQETSETIPVFQAANMSLGVNLIIDLVAQAACVLGDHFDIEILEMHHNQKIDAPSGTALALADSINSALSGGKRYVYGRCSRTQRRDSAEIGIHAIRGGTLVGEHQVHFIGTDEVVEIAHRAQSKQIFAQGALQAAAFIAGKSAGFYTMKDLLLEHSAVTHLYIDEEQALVTLHGLPAGDAAANLFAALAREKINIDMISQTAPDGGRVVLSFTLPLRDADRSEQVIRQAGIPSSRIDIRRDIVKLTVEGPGMARQTGVASRFASALARCGIGIEAITTSETKISGCVDASCRDSAANALTEAFGL